MIFTAVKKRLRDRTFWKYVLEFFAILLVLYLFSVFALGMDSPGFTYAEF
jgi:hypothetical protein